VRDGRNVGGIRYTREGAREPGPTWIALHGITRGGGDHPSLRRFAKALAGSGATVVVPEVPEWRELHTTASAADETALAAIASIDEDPCIDGDRIGLVGFSFGAPQAILATRAPGVTERVGSVAGFGGYADLSRTFLFMVTGEFEWEGVRYHVPPDPYGRWIVAGNSLTLVPGLEDAEDVSRGILALAREAGDRAIPSDSPDMEELRLLERARIAAPRLSLFDMLAPGPGVSPRREEALELADALGAAARVHSPRLDPCTQLGQIATPIHLIHGRGDRLIPFTETLRMASCIAPSALQRTEITRLFEHSQRAGAKGAGAVLSEAPRFLRALHVMLNSL